MKLTRWNREKHFHGVERSIQQTMKSFAVQQKELEIRNASRFDADDVTTF